MTTSVLPSANIDAILRNTPHRFPFLLIDRIEACEPGKWVRVIRNVSANDAVMPRVPLAQKVMPQMLVVEALAQAAGSLCKLSGMMDTGRRSIMFFAGVDNCRFQRDVYPGDQVMLECHMKRAMRGVAKISGTATVDGALVLEADLTAVVRDIEPEPVPGLT
ncbi:MAG: 3-hydroxyacyl-ACP dehydratase FabZ [Burkholderiales bacterium]